MNFLEIVVLIFEFIIFFYGLFVMLSYVIISIIAASRGFTYIKERNITNYNALLGYPLMPSIAIIAPAYNEEVIIKDNIRSLLSLYYSNFTVIIVNDGSKDKTLQIAIEEYELEQIEFNYIAHIKTKPVRGVYRSKNPAFKNLVLVDKINGGGKADASNAGINIADTEYFVCTDVDCVIEPDIFLKMVQPIMSTKEPVIGVGGAIWLTNDALIEGGKLIKAHTPHKNIARFQVIEYFRAFLLGRTAWARINGSLLISGALGLFHRDTVVKVGGYSTSTVAEDMDLVMRMHLYMRDRGLPYRLAYVPEPLCWTEAPDTEKVLAQQRNRWARGTVECLVNYKKMFFNPKYGILGLVSYPYWFFAEWLAPLLEASGIIYILVAAYFGWVSWKFCMLLLLFVYSFSMCISIFAIAFQEVAYHKYETPSDVLKLFLTVFIEPFLHHPRTVWWSLQGNYDKLTGKKRGWGTMTRTGFNAASKQTTG
jgi:cellulose synthase/poly-beta-1,6-N-acetylglucosamine synthase-like glycosyltransferase